MTTSDLIKQTPELKHMIAVTNRQLCSGDFIAQCHRICSAHPDRIILREKDLTDDAYENLLKALLPICKGNNIALSVSNRPALASKYKTDLHLSYHTLMDMHHTSSNIKNYATGVSVHAPSEAYDAVIAGASYIIAGHIFATDCKKDVPPRGLDFLKAVCEQTAIACDRLCIGKVPVYAIGGITPDKLKTLFEYGAAGGCMMSLAMQL